MKRFKFPYVILGLIAVLLGIVVMRAAAPVSQADQFAPQHITVLKGDSQPEAETNVQDAEISLNEWGYTYNSVANSDSKIETIDTDNLLSGEANHGEDGESLEAVLSWSDAREILKDDILCWLNNDYLNSCMDDVSFIVSGSDIAIAKYITPTSKAEVYVFTVSEENDESFEFGRNYTSELYNIRQINEGHKWQCFSYSGYDGAEYTSAVLADKNMVCEIKFEKCDEQFICNTLAAYNI